MLRVLGRGLLISSLFFTVSAIDTGFSNCNCDDDGLWAIESILKCQKVSDLLIALAYFSIPIELGYFVSCSNLPFKWVLIQFIAFIVLCGLTHLFTAWVYEPHSFQMMLALTVFKFLTALVSCATSITLVTMIPLLLRVKVRELFLKNKTRELNREVGMMKKQEEASWHVRMLTREIRKSLDRHTILYTTLVELSKTLLLHNCAVWMPNEERTVMILTHELKQRNSSSDLPIPINDSDVQEIKGSKGVKILRPDSPLGLASSGGDGEPGGVAAIRMPMLRVSNFKGGTPELIQACYAILVLVLPNVDSRSWSYQELEIVEVVADQVAVAISHAAVLEESQLMREKLVEQNRVLQQAKRDAMMASQARNSFQKVMSHGMRRPMHSISGLLSMMQLENLGPDQRLIVDAMAKTSSVVSTLINDVMEISTVDNGTLTLQMRSFRLHHMIKEAACLAKCMCVFKGFDFGVQVEKTVPDWVIGDEKRIFQVILHMVGNLLTRCDGGFLMFRVLAESGSEGGQDQRWVPWRMNSSQGYAYVKFEIRMSSLQQNEASTSLVQIARRPISDRTGSNLSFSMCKKLVQMMQGDIWVVPNSQGFAESMMLVLRFQLQPTVIPEPGGSSENPPSSLFRGLKVLVADDDDVNRSVTRRLLEKLGCNVSAVASGVECLNSLGAMGTSFQVILLDLHMPEMDGFEVARRIPKYRSGSWPLIVALTASADEDVWERCLQTGMNGVIRKPVLLQTMRDELYRVLQASQVV